MSKKVLVLAMVISLVAFVTSPASGVSIDLTSGPTGTTYLNQSFNETRGVEVSIVGGNDLQVTAMTLKRFDINTDSGGTVGARIYDSLGNLLARTNQIVGFGADQSVTIAISALLQNGDTYRLAFFVSTDNWGGNADLFDPDPPNSMQFFPFTDSTHNMQILQYYSEILDAFPTKQNIGLPFITVEANPVPEPSAYLLLSSGFACMYCFFWKRRRCFK